MGDLIERLNLIIAQCRDSKESADLWTEVRDEIERLTDELINVEQLAKDRYCEMQSKIERLEAAALKTLKEQDMLDEHHSAACMNCSFLEHSQHQCGLCDLRAALEGEK